MFLAALSMGTLLGAILLTNLQQLPPSSFVIGMWLSVIFLAFLGCSFKQFNIAQVKRLLQTNITIFILGLILGFSWAHVQASQRLKWQLPQDWVGKTLKFNGQIVSYQHRATQSSYYTIKLVSLKDKSFSGYLPKIKVSARISPSTLPLGSTITGTVKLKNLKGLYNPGAFDSEKLWFLNGLCCQGRLLSVDEVSNNKRSLLSVRGYMVERLQSVIHDEPFLPIIIALTMGLKSDIPFAMKQVFQQTGTSHLLAISGLHLGLIASLCFFCLLKLIPLFPSLLLRVSAPILSAWLTLGLSFCYALMAGFSLPTQRALIMITVFMVGIIMKIKIFSWQALMLALLFVVLYDPLCVLDSGFWLSFLAVAALLLAQSNSTNRHFENLSKWWQPQWRVFLALLPLSVLFFNQVSLISPIANLFAIPIVGLIVVPFSLLGVTLFFLAQPIGVFFIKVASMLFSLVWALLSLLSDLPLAYVSLNAPSKALTVLGVIGVFVALLPRGLPGRSLGLLAILPMLFFKQLLPAEQAKVSILDVGQGLACVIQTKNHTLLYDAGPKFGLNASAGAMVILPFLQSQKITQIDKVIISHHDLDHRGGLTDLLSLQIKELQSSEPQKLAAVKGLESLSHTKCQAGQKWEYDGVRFEMLHPLKQALKSNDTSCVLKVTAQKQSILFTGDISTTVERQLINQYGTQLKSDVLVVPHHGSRTSSSMTFIEAINPKYAVYSVGYGNIYKLPSQTILERYKYFGSDNLLTHNTGAIQFVLGKARDLTPPTKWRETHKRLWHLL